MPKTLTQKLRGWIPKSTQLVLWMVALPLAMTLFAYWEHTQFADAPQRDHALENQAEIQSLEELLGRIQNDPYATLEINGKKYGNPLASNKVRDAIAQLKGENLRGTPDAVKAVVRPAIAVAMAAGAVATLLGLLGLLMVHWAGLRAMRSRDDLMRAFALWHVNLPRYLAVLLVTQLVAIGALTVVRGYVAYAAEHASRAEMKGHFYLLALALALMWSGLLTLWRLRGSLHRLDLEPSQVLGRAVTPQEAPGLWRYVAEMAQRVGAAMPAHIVVGVADSFYVTAQGIVLHPTGQQLRGETMYLPLTYLAMLRRDEIDAVVAHELGHFAGEDTGYSLRFSPLYRGLGRRLQAIEGDAAGSQWGSIPAITFCTYLLQRFDHAVMHWSRVREFAADQASARVAGAQAGARALIRMTALDTAVREVVAGIARRPDEAGHDLVELLSQALQQQGLARPDFAHEVSTTHPSDTHPPTVERLHALGQPLGEPLLGAALSPVDGDAQAWVRSLFSDSQSLQRQLLDDFKDAARERNDEVRQQLSAMANQVSASVEIHDKRTLLWIGAGLGLVCLLVAVLGGLMAVIPGKSGNAGDGLGVFWFASAGTAFFGAMAFWSWKRSSATVMALTPSGLRAPGLQNELGWGQVGDYAITENNGSIVLQFDIDPQAPEPTLLHRNYFRLAYVKKKRQLSINMSGVRGMKNKAFYELLGNYLKSWHAREQLKSM